MIKPICKQFKYYIYYCKDLHFLKDKLKSQMILSVFSFNFFPLWQASYCIFILKLLDISVSQVELDLMGNSELPSYVA